MMKTRKIISLFLATALIVSLVIGTQGGLKEVRADGGVAEYGIIPSIEIFKDNDQGYESFGTSLACWYSYDGSEFDSSGNAEVEIDISSIKGHISGESKNEKLAYVVTNNKAYKINGDKLKITINKNDFERANSSDEKFYRLKNISKIYIINSNVKNAWYEGFWFDGNGENTYSAKGEWKGSGSFFWFEDSTGWYPSSCWQKISKDGVFAFSYGTKDGKIANTGWYYFKDNGYCACNEWLEIDGSWYYFDENGNYLRDTWIDGYYLDDNGVQSYAPTGSWKGDGSGWWFEDSSGWYPADKDVAIDGQFYYFKSNGYMAQNEWIQTTDEFWKKYNYNYWKHYNDSGICDKTGQYDESGNWVEHSDDK